MPTEPLSFQTEVQDQIVYIIDQLQKKTPYIEQVFEFSSRLDPERLAQATRLVYQAEPIFGCRFLEDRAKPRWVFRDDLKSLCLTQITDAPQMEDALQVALAETYEETGLANFKTHLLRGPHGDTLIVKVVHLVVDGTAAIKAANLLAEIYTQLAANPNHSPTPNLTANRDSFQWLSEFSFGDKLKMLVRHVASTVRGRSPKTKWGLADATHFEAPATRPFFRFYTLPAERVRELEKAARARKCSLNDILLTGFYRAYHHFVNPPPNVRLEVMVPTNMRRYLKGGDSPAMCNLGGFIFMNIGAQLGEDFDATLALVKEESQRQKRDFMGLGGQMLAGLLKGMSFEKKQRMLRKATQAQLKSPTSPVFSNIGSMDRAKLSFAGISPERTAMVSTPIRFPAFAVILTRYGDAITLACSFSEDDVQPERVECFLKDVDEEIKLG